MIAVAAPPAVDDDLEAFLREQLEAIADELWWRVYRLEQRIWTSADCPWCRNLARRQISGVACPICDQIKRSRRSRREEEKNA